jgi:RNA polymerase sigma-70 factor (ECF subfamily)
MKREKVTKRVNLSHKQVPADPVQDEFASLVRSAAAGDAEALDRLLMRAQEAAWRFSTSVCGHADDAEDAMQEALIKTYRYVGRIREPAAFRPWLYRTVRNACLMGRRKQAGEPARLQSLDAVLPGPDGRARPDAPHPGKNPEQLANNSLLRRRLRDALHVTRLPDHRVPPGHRRVVDASRDGDGDVRDNVKTRLHRARVQLQAHLGRMRYDRRGPPLRALPRTGPGVVALSGRRPGARPSSTIERHIKTCACCGTMTARLRSGGRLPRRRQAAAAHDVMSRAAKRVRALVAREGDEQFVKR